MVFFLKESQETVSVTEEELKAAEKNWSSEGQLKIKEKKVPVYVNPLT